jgi:hypothetical protein
MSVENDPLQERTERFPIKKWSEYILKYFYNHEMLWAIPDWDKVSKAIVNPHMGSYGYLKRGSIFKYVGCTGTNVSHQDIHLTCVEESEESEGKCTGMDNDGYKLEFDKHCYVSLSNSHCVKYSPDGD